MKMYFIFFEVFLLGLLLLSLLFLILLFILIASTTIEICYLNRAVKVKLILLYVIKIKLKAKTSKVKAKTSKIKEKTIKKRKNYNLVLFVFKIKDPIINFISELKLKIIADGGFFINSPSTTAFIYGIGNASIYPILSYTSKFFKAFVFTNNLKPNFNGLGQNLNLNIKINFKNITIFILIFKLIPQIIKNRKLLVKVE